MGSHNIFFLNERDFSFILYIMRLISNLLYPFKLLAKIPYYKLGSYAFLAFLMYYAFSEAANYIFWSISIDSNYLSLEALQYERSFLQLMNGNLASIFSMDTEHFIVLPKIFIYLAYSVFEGNRLFANIINVILSFYLIYFVARVLKSIHLKRYTYWIIIMWTTMMVFVPSNLSSMGPERIIWLLLYFFVFLSLYLLFKIDQLPEKVSKKHYLLHVGFCMSLIFTTLTFTNGIFIWPVVLFLLLIRKRYKIFGIYSVFFVLVAMFVLYYYTFYSAFKSEHNTHLNNYIQFFVSLFAVPTVWDASDVTPLSTIFHYLRFVVVFGCTLWMLYVLLIRYSIKNFSLKNIRKTSTPYPAWHQFFLGIFLFSFGNIVFLSIFRNFHSYISIDSNYQLNSFMLGVSLFAFFAIYIYQYKKKILSIVLSLFILYYATFVLINYTHLQISQFGNVAIKRVIQLSMEGTATTNHVVGGDQTFRKIWNLSGYHVWQRNIIGLNINTYLLKSPTILWFIKNPICKQCVKYLEATHKSQGKFGYGNKANDTIHLFYYGMFPYTFSTTYIVTNKQGTIVGYGINSYHNVWFLNIFTVWTYIFSTKFHIITNGEIYFYNYNAKVQHSYTLWAVGLDRRHITPLYTFTLTPKPVKQRYIWR